MKPKEVAEGIFSTKTLARIENHEQIPAVDKFVRLLSRLNVTFDEFLFYAGDDMKRRSSLKLEMTEVLRRMDLARTKALRKKVSAYLEEEPELYLQHMADLLKAVEATIVNHDFEAAKEHLTGIVRYLDMDEWYEYELGLFNNIFHFYDYQTAKSLCEKAVRTLQKKTAYFKDIELSYSIYNNFALKALEEGEFEDAYAAIKAAMDFPVSTKAMYGRIVAKIIHQIISFRLEKPDYNEKELQNYLDFFRFMDMPHITHGFLALAREHGWKNQ